MGCAASREGGQQGLQPSASPRISQNNAADGTTGDNSHSGARNALSLDLSAHSHARDLPLHLDQQKVLEEAEELAAAGDDKGALHSYQLALRLAAAKAKDTPEGSLGVAPYLEKLAACHVRMKDGDKAISLLHRLVLVREKALGVSHGETLSAVRDMASCLMTQQMYDSAVPLFSRILKAAEAAGHGPESKEGIAASADLGACLFKAGRADDALPLLKAAVEGRTAQLSPSHADTLSSQQMLANCLLRLGKHAEAEPLLRQLVDALTASPAFGSKHADTLQAADNLAHCLAEMGDHKRSELLYSKSLKQRRESLGHLHPATSKSRKGLITMLTEQGASEEALPLLREALEVARSQQGAAGVSAQEAMHGVASAAAALGRCLLSLKQWGEAATHYGEAVRVGKDLFGDLAAADPDVLRWMAGLAEALGELPGRRQEALDLWLTASQGCAAVLGAQHADTQRCQQRLASLQRREAGGEEKPAPPDSGAADGGQEGERPKSAAVVAMAEAGDSGDAGSTVQVLMGEGGEAIERGDAGEGDQGRWAATAEPAQLLKAASGKTGEAAGAGQAEGQTAEEGGNGQAAAQGEHKAAGLEEGAAGVAAQDDSAGLKALPDEEGGDAVTLLVDAAHQEVAGMEGGGDGGAWAASATGGDAAPARQSTSRKEGDAALQVQDA